MLKCVYIAFICSVFILSCKNSGDKAVKRIENSAEVNMSAPFYSHEIPDNHPRVSKIYDSTKIKRYGPFIAYKDGSYMVSAEVEMDQSLSEYLDLFMKHGAGSSGDTWAGLLKVALRAENPELLNKIDLDPETGGFYAFANSERSQEELAAFGQKLFTDTTKLVKYLNGRDREKILNYDPRD